MSRVHTSQDKINYRKIKQLMRVSKFTLNEYRKNIEVEKYLERHQIRYLKQLAGNVIDKLTQKKVRDKVT